jgi:REP element-mobilizing transposase RayT
MHAYLVFLTNYRRAVFTQQYCTALYGIFTDVCAAFEAQRVHTYPNIRHKL